MLSRIVFNPLLLGSWGFPAISMHQEIPTAATTECRNKGHSFLALHPDSDGFWQQQSLLSHTRSLQALCRALRNLAKTVKAFLFVFFFLKFS